MREPSIHIPRTALNDLIESWFDSQGIGKSSESLVEYLFKNGSRFNLIHRKKLDNYSGTKRKSYQLQSSTAQDAHLFAGLLKKLREQRRHRGVSTIVEGSKDWGLIKECTSKAVGFINDYQLEKREGFIIYLELYLSYIDNNRSKFNINGIPSKHGMLCDMYEAKKEIEQDPNVNDTVSAHLAYCAAVSEKTGIPINYQKDTLKYVYFVYAVKLAKQYGLTPKEYIRAQFQTLDWTNGIPAPAQLITKNAEERTVRWMAQHGIKKSNKTNPNAMNKQDMAEFWKKVKQASKYGN
jgi:hypothetical protein